VAKSIRNLSILVFLVASSFAVTVQADPQDCSETSEYCTVQQEAFFCPDGLPICEGGRLYAPFHCSADQLCGYEQDLFWGYCRLPWPC
jgi:hypothetical protein